MPKKFSDGQPPVDAAPQLIKDDLRGAAEASLKPHKVRAKRKPMWVYLSSRERDAAALKAIESGGFVMLCERQRSVRSRFTS